jgi:putative tricarboxylic transport membrane protein
VELFELMGVGFAAILNVKIILFMIIGAFGGKIFAGVPGLSTGMAVILTLPLTYGMTGVEGLATMSAVYIGGMSGGLIGSTLLGIPGTSSAVATTFDGYPLAKKGFPGKAMGIGIWASFFGGLFGAIILMAVAPVIARLASKMGPWEYTSLILFGLTMIAGLTGKTLLKGFIAGVLGILLGTVGADPIYGASRLTFGISSLRGGIGFIPVMIGMYAISQLMSGIEKDSKRVDLKQERMKIPHLECIIDIFKNIKAMIISMLSGVFIGALPGVGATISNIWSYDQVKRLSNKKEEFGKGSTEGIIGAEGANSATAGGTLIPMLALGLPGNPISVIMMGAVIIHGIIPGPLFITEYPNLAYGLFAAFLLANFIVLIEQSIFTNLYVKVLTVPHKYLVPIIIVFCVIGSYAHNNRMFDVFVMFAAGLVGYGFKKLNIPIAPIVLGMILGPTVEENFRLAIMTSPEYTLFFTRPVSLLFIVLTILSIYLSIKQQIKPKKKSKTEVL